eukprot:GHVP01033659.1.p1 GENE.GHVP01033659.1~~GHVP01033659.1.p1  ORF type:complete len:222 (+),score=69.04 GHVP01033659.1:76-666(+)
MSNLGTLDTMAESVIDFKKPRLDDLYWYRTIVDDLLDNDEYSCLDSFGSLSSASDVSTDEELRQELEKEEAEAAEEEKLRRKKKAEREKMRCKEEAKEERRRLRNLQLEAEKVKKQKEENDREAAIAEEEEKKARREQLEKFLKENKFEGNSPPPAYGVPRQDGLDEEEMFGISLNRRDNLWAQTYEIMKNYQLMR